MMTVSPVDRTRSRTARHFALNSVTERVMSLVYMTGHYLNTLKQVKGRDFEVVEMGTVITE
jgi:hypothetical protein